MTKQVDGQISMQDLGIWCGKTYPERSAATEAKTSRRSSPRSSGSRAPKAPMCLCLIGGGRWTQAGCLYDQLGRWSVAWRVHDAQFWGVPQRRKRIALVADFGGLTASEILFERKSLSGDIEPGATERKETTGGVGESVDSTEPILLESNQNHATVQTDGISTALPAAMGMGGGYVPMVARTISARMDGSYATDRGPDVIVDNNGGNSACNQGGMAVVALEGNGTRDSHRGDGYKETETMCTLNSVEQHAVFASHGQDARYNNLGDVCETISAKYGMGGGNAPIVLND